MRNRGNYWTVQMTRKNGGTFYPNSRDGATGHLFFSRAVAMEYANELAKEMGVPRRRLKAVKVRVTIEEV